MKKILMMIMVVALLALPLAVFAQPTGGVTTSISNETGTASTTTQQNITAGTITNVNVSGVSITGRWAGFYGNVSAGLELSDSSGNRFYEWTVSTLTNGVVYAVNGTTTFGDIIAGSNANMPSNIQGAGTDNYTNTFANTASFTNSSSIGAVASTPYVDTYQNDAAGVLRTWSLYDNTDSVQVWAGAIQENVVAFDGGVVTDFQILVPASTATTAYNFYLELP